MVMSNDSSENELDTAGMDSLSGTSDTITSDDTRLIFQWIGYSLVCEFIDIFGTLSNIINIICFMKLGFRDSINVSLLGLAISDFFCVASLVWTNICMNPAFSNVDLPFEPVGFQYITTGWLHVIFSRITSWITAFITLERLLCIAAPLKVKGIFTSKRVAAIIVFMYLVLLMSASPLYVVNNLMMVYFPGKNKTLIALVATNNRKNVEQGSFAFNNVTVPLSAFMIIIICTVILVIKLRSHTKWRKSATASQNNKLSNRDQRVIKMVVTISTFFIVCFIPVSIVFIPMAVMPEFKIDGKYGNTNTIFIGFCLILESTNSSANIFIYYFMSSKYRCIFNELFNFKKESNGCGS